MDPFLRALQAIPNDEKTAYLTALDRCPKLLQLESCPSWFLQHDRDDAPKAARRFVDYWEKRKTVFGHHKAFLPMTLLNGALSESCNSLIHDGWIASLPPDESKKRVCFLDMSVEAIRYQHSLEDRLCCLFYALQVISQEITAQVQGFVLIILYDDFCHSPKGAIESFEEILRAMPVNVAEVHLIATSKMRESTDFFEEFIPRALKCLLCSTETDQTTILNTRQHIYLTESQEAILTILGRKGLRQQSLPYKIGGGWSSDHHWAWMKIRLSKEAETYTGLSLKESQATFPDFESTTGRSLVSAERRRRREAKHSRQKRDRKRCREKALMIHIRYLEQKRRTATLMNKNLTKGLKEAKKLVKQIGNSDKHSNVYTISAPSSFLGVPSGLTHQPQVISKAMAVSASGPVSVVVIPPGAFPPSLLPFSHGDHCQRAPMPSRIVLCPPREQSTPPTFGAFPGSHTLSRSAPFVTQPQITYFPAAPPTNPQLHHQDPKSQFYFYRSPYPPDPRYL